MTRAADLDGAPPIGEGDLALVGGRIVDGGGGPARERATVLIRDGVVTEVRDGAAAPAGYRVIDLAGRTVLPGLIDAHVHLNSLVLPDPPRGELAYEANVRPYAQAAASRAMLEGGITTSRDLGSNGRELFALRRCDRRAASAPGRGSCCAARSSRPPRPAAASSPSMYREADGPDEVRKAVREQIQQGADFIKVMTTGARSVALEDREPAQMTPAEVEAVVEESHRQGFRVASHAEGLPGTELSVDAGIDTIEHGMSCTARPSCSSAWPSAGIVLVPTLSVFELVAEIRSCCFTPLLVEQAKRLREDANATVAAARAAGVTLVMGYDSHPHGANASELVRLVKAGMTAAEAVVAGTSGAAAACGLEDVGRVAPGQLADLVVVDGDPMSDIGVLADDAKRWLVLLGGNPVAGRALDASDPTREVHHG